MSGTPYLWFEETLEIPSGRTIKIEIENLIERIDSKFQRIEVYKTKPFGRMLVLDGVIMCTEWDECAYHEMITHVPLFAHTRPEKVLIIGGGDGGTAREVIKHPSVKQVDVCEIDEEVVNISRRHLPVMACSFDDSRVKLYPEDGARFIRERKNSYDVIIVDSSDPIGPAEVLFSEEFYASMKECLKEDGIAVTQSESFYYHGDIVERLTGFAKKLYPQQGYYYTLVPTYPSGIIGFTFCSRKYHPLRDYRESDAAAMLPKLRYYNPGVHKGAFSLPNFIKNRIGLEGF